MDLRTHLTYVELSTFAFWIPQNSSSPGFLRVEFVLRSTLNNIKFLRADTVLTTLQMDHGSDFTSGKIIYDT